jgi:flagellar M-ring protein FliF
MADNENMIATLARSGRMRIAAALIVTALVGGGLGVIMLRGGDAGMVPLYTGLDLDEAGDIAAKLDTANVNYKLDGSGTTIMVDRSKLDSARMLLAEQGLPSKGSVGWEIFDKQEVLGQTSFVQNINKVRALQGELERSINALDMVKASRVALAISDKPLFQRDAVTPPKASVTLQLTGSQIAQSKVRAIQNIVAASVPGLSADHVTVVDDKGRMLASGGNSDDANGGGSASSERKVAMEEDLRQKVLDIVENITGQGAARVTVSMDVDFNRMTQTQEKFDPDSRVLRSSTTTEQSSNNTDSEPGDTASVAQNVPQPGGAPSPNNAKSQAATTSTSETQNYEISKTVSTEVIDGGRVKKLSVAVALDHERVAGANGQPATFNARTPEQLAQIASLVKSAVGFDQARGDTVTVENIPFARPDAATDLGKPPGAFDFDKFDIVHGVEIGALLITALALVFFVLRPLVRGLMSPKDPKGGGGEISIDPVTGQAIAGPSGAAAIGAAPHMSAGGQTVAIPDSGPVTFDIPAPDRLDAGIDVARINGQVKASSIKKISEVVSSHPDESLAIIRSWLAEEGRAA